ncbi:MAG TPA: HupE/UreJ family protein, partial [Candidatus Eisenbacteria bacterium]|nr:HupE/UreJ family protein [Candidatus Eisenbacteria bacterium]
IHGFGFASVLREFGLPHQALAWSLLGFNLGVEVGQASIVLAVVPLLGMLRAGLPRVAARAVAAGSWGIVLTGGFWFVERVLARG